MGKNGLENSECGHFLCSVKGHFPILYLQGQSPEVSPGIKQTSKMENFATIINGFQLVCAVCPGPAYASGA